MSKHCFMWKKTSWVMQIILHKICSINVGFISWEKPTLMTPTMYSRSGKDIIYLK
jgi:hypothetical protein